MYSAGVMPANSAPGSASDCNPIIIIEANFSAMELQRDGRCVPMTAQEFMSSL
jgi:hypothetical protein